MRDFFAYFWVLFLIAYCLWMKFWPVILCCLIAFIAVIVIRCSIPRKKEALIRIAAVIMGICITGAITWCVLFPTAYPYVDLWVLGKTEEQIIEKYGEPDFSRDEDHRHDEIAYYTRYIIMDADYYIITFDENGKAVDVREDLFVPLGG